MKRLILTAIVVLFSTLTGWAQTATTVPPASAPAVATPAQAGSTSAHPRNRHQHHTHHSHRHSGVNARR
jgi:hypothetical protein